MYLQDECKTPVSLAPALKLYNQPAIGAEWLFLGTGIGASNQFEAGGFIRRDAEFDWPNLQYHFLPLPDARRLDALAQPRPHPRALEGPARTSQHPVQLHVA
ncbi:hypothetical protein G6F59_017292 [Rhizopus arrhizus]|nr:hypothetical protein G6F59_017292 [Rhizopus arrhizus]